MVLITPDDQRLLIAKKGGKFRVALDASHTMVLHGDAMVSQA